MRGSVPADINMRNVMNTC